VFSASDGMDLSTSTVYMKLASVLADKWACFGFDVGCAFHVCHLTSNAGGGGKEIPSCQGKSSQNLRINSLQGQLCDF